MPPAQALLDEASQGRRGDDEERPPVIQEEDERPSRTGEDNPLSTESIVLVFPSLEILEKGLQQRLG